MTETISILREPSKFESVLSSLLTFPLKVLGSTHWEYFQHLNELVNESIQSIHLVGYDTPYMENAQTRTAFEEANKRGVRLEAIIPEGIKTYLDKLQPSTKINIMRHPKQMDSGFLVLDELHTAQWDSKRQTVNPLEKFTGVYWRMTRNYGYDFAEKHLRYFERLKGEINKK